MESTQNKFKVVTKKTGYIIISFDRRDLAEDFIKNADENGQYYEIKES